MRFSHKFIAFLLVSMVLLIVGNIASVVYFAPRYFHDYVEEVRKEFPNDEYSLINAFIASKDLDPATIEEYRLTLEDLKSLSKSLESYAPSPEQWNPSTFESLQRIGFATDTIKEVLFLNSVENFLRNLVSIVLSKDETPEQNFLLRMLSMLFFVNVALISLILLITYVWTRLIFKPTIALSERISRLTQTRDYSPVVYTRSDEFAPLVAAANTLSANLARQEKIRSNFLSDFSHEIKTPITALKMFMEGVEDGVVKLDADGMNIVRSEIGRLISTTDSMMEYERLVALEDERPNRSEFDLVELFCFLEKEYSPMLAKHAQSIQFDRETPFVVNLERNLIVRLTHNIVSNFIKYSGEGKTLSIKWLRRSGRIHITFSDDGHGVKKSNVPFLHEKFYQEDSSRSGGSDRWIGIGLSIVDKIAKIHGGYMQIQSDIDKGFTLKLAFME